MPRSSKWHLFPPNPACTSSLVHMCPMPHQLHSSWFYHLGNIAEECKLVKSANQEAPQCAISSGPLLPTPISGPNVFLSYFILKNSQNGTPICAYFGITWYVWHCLLNQIDASIWFNKQCQTYHVTPKYAQIHLKDKNICIIKTNMFRDIPIDGN